MRKIFIYIFLYSTATLLLSKEQELAPIYNKSRFGLGYNLGLTPQVGKIVGKGKNNLSGLHRGYFMVDFPFNPYFSWGASIDYTLALSHNNKDPNLSISKDSSRLITHFLGISSKLKPQWPISFHNFDIIFYTELQTGLGTSSPIFFGTQPLSDYEYKNTSNIPSPFPLYLESTPKIGWQLFGLKFLAIDLGFGYRILWVVHPMVKIDSKRIMPNMKKDSNGALWYDISSMFIDFSLHFAF